MSWFVLALVTALFTSFYDVIIKKVSNEIDPYLLVWAWMFFPVPFFGAFLLKSGWPTFGPGYYVALIGSTIILYFASLFYIKAIQASPLSMTMPMLTFTPLFLLLTSWIMLGEQPKGMGLLGILLIIGGSYVLNLKDRQHGYWAPWKNLLRERGPRYMLLVAFLYSIGANFDKIGVLNSSSAAWMLSLHLCLSFLFGILVLRKGKNIRSHFKKKWIYLLGIGLCTALALVCQMTAIRLTIVPYVISIKRTSVIFSSLFGFVLFKEKELSQRLTGISLMVLGVFAIALDSL